jgi:hypothetical protein
LPFPYGLRRKEANVMVVRVGRKREGRGDEIENEGMKMTFGEMSKGY